MAHGYYCELGISFLGVGSFVVMHIHAAIFRSCGQMISVNRLARVRAKTFCGRLIESEGY